MKMFFKPITPWKTTQKFGADQVCFRDLPDGTKEYAGKKTEEDCKEKYGSDWDSVYRKMKGHNGIDIRAYRWQPVYCAQAGICTFSGQDKDKGNYVEIETEWEGKRYRHRYKHFMANAAVKGALVKTGQHIGWAGDTGRATAVHLHFDVRQFNELGEVIGYNNGYFGFVNPAPLMYDDSAVSVSILNTMIEMASVSLERLSRLIRKIKKNT